jgi:hypothetical protein
MQQSSVLALLALIRETVDRLSKKEDGRGWWAEANLLEGWREK